MEPTQTETLFGGTKVSVQFKGKTDNEEVFVRQLEVDAYPKLLDISMDEFKQIELYCDKPAGWAKTLTPKSHNEIMETAERLNSDFFSPWAARQLKRLERIRPGLVETAMRAALPSRTT
jgi:hypothetical protein